ncbi:MAG: hypothetical protein EOO20_08205 [Chryseobacterium sp.]|nr:MAG: hypothetical protein EOO20_08205 [Chryseobacterium sp.]
MKYLRLFILLLIFCNLPGYCLVNVSANTGALLSYTTFLLIAIYYIINQKEPPIIPFIIFGFSFFLVSILVNADHADTFLVLFIKYFLVIIMGAVLLKHSNKIELFAMLLFGAASIIFEAVFLKGTSGRFSGFYLNANPAGFACILGYALSITMEDKRIKMLGQLVFTVAGFATFSRTFLLIWVLINICSLLISFKNIYSIFAGLILFSLFLSLETKTDLDTKRVGAFSALLEGKVDDDLTKEPRTETWAVYYDKILNNPIFGNGYHAFSGEVYGNDSKSYTIHNGVHNTFLMVLGEAGFFIFLFFCWIYGYLLFIGVKMFKVDPQVFLISFSMILYMLTNHNYFENYVELFVSMYLYIKIKSWKEKNSDVTQINLLNYKRINPRANLNLRTLLKHKVLSR